MSSVGIDLKLAGIDDLAALGQALKDAGDKELRRELLRAGQRLTKPVKDNIKKHAVTDLPRRGGLNRWVESRLNIKTQVRLSGKNVGIRIVSAGKGTVDMRAINNGKVRHPLFGDRDHWYLTAVRPGFVARAIDEMADDVREEFLQAVADVAARLR